MPAHGHTHTNPTVNGGAHTHKGWSRTKAVGTGSGYVAVPSGTTSAEATGNAVASSEGGHTHTVSGGGVGNATAQNASAAHENMPPYIALNYIIYTGA